MDKTRRLLASFLIVLVSAFSCRNGSEKEISAGSEDLSEMMLIGQDMITEVIVKPDTLGDPWEVEKVRGFEGTGMFKSLLGQIYDGKLVVYDCLAEEKLSPDDVRKLEQEFNSDLSRIAKLQFLEDWYYDPASAEVIRKIRSVSFGYEVQRDGGLPPGYFPLFRIKMKYAGR